MKKLTTSFLACVLLTSVLFAGGFQTGTQNARAMGMGSAFVGMASDASAIYFNPGGLANVKGLSILAGTTLIMPTLDFTGPTPLTTNTKSVDRTFTPINFYASYGMGNGFAFGVGVNNPYGLGTEWPATWLGKRLGVKTELRTFYITPTVSYKVSDNFSIGAGFSYIISDVLFSQAADFPAIPLAPGINLPAAPNVGINLEGNGDPAYTFVVGLLFKASKDVSLGVSYRHSAEINFNGDLTFKNLPAKPTGFPIGHSNLFPEGKGKASLTMPSDLRAGVSFNATKDLTINADLMYVGWDSYKELAVDFEKNSAAWADLKTLKNWENSFGLKVGGEYRMDQLAFRAGYVFDGSPIPTKYMDPTLPGSDRHEFTLGLGYQIMPCLRVDAAFQYISFESEVKDSALPFNGVYKNSTQLFGFNIAYNLK